MKYKIMIPVIILIIFSIVYFTKIANNFPLKQDLKHEPNFFGVTYSKKFCTEIGLDWKEVYGAILTDLKVKEIRLPIYWDEVEVKEGIYDFSDYDYLINEGAKNNVKFIVNIGWRLPRWPECHAPEWINGQSLKVTQERTLKMLERAVNHYKDNPAITTWQIENEPFFDAFGICPPSDENFFKSELDLVRKLDNRPILITATGELGNWKKEGKLADIFGSTVYRVVWGNISGYVRYPIPAWFYGFKAYLAGIKPENRIVIELQAEPWVPNESIIYLSEKEANKSFNIKQFKANLQYAINIGFNKSYLWGVEWWYFKAKTGDDSYWQLAKTIFN